MPHLLVQGPVTFTLDSRKFEYINRPVPHGAPEAQADPAKESVEGKADRVPAALKQQGPSE